jgi:preprotein translocase subunit Sss1
VKKLLKIAGLGFAGLFVGLMVLGFLIQVVDPEGVKRRAEERKNRKPAKKASVADQPGFTMGFLEGGLRKTKGFKKPTSDELDALARKAAYENGVDEGKRSAFVGTYKDAFWHGWSRAK